MAGIHADSPSSAYRDFKEELNRLLHTTITQAPLVSVETPAGTLIEFRAKRSPVCVHVGKGLYLFIGQTITAVEELGKGFRVRTLAYGYRVSLGQALDSPYVIRWEYVSRELRQGLAPRHHLHIPCQYQGLDFGRLHTPTGWITVEEVIRFLIQELGVTPLSGNWDEILRESEERFRQRTARGGSAS